jgi:ferredoxin, 2Fe-2S
MAQIIVIDREGVEHQVEGVPGGKIMEMLRDLDFGVAAICGGMCSCATCHVYIDESWQDRLSPPSLDESYLLQALSSYRQSASRLSCQIEFTDALDGIQLMIAPSE